jgi:uncharacterized protein YcaQ
MVHQLSRREARCIAVRAQLLGASRPTSLLELIRHLGLVQIDLTATVAPSADLVCWSRLGSSYTPADLDALRVDRSLVEFRGVLRPAEDIALFRAALPTQSRRRGTIRAARLAPGMAAVHGQGAASPAMGLAARAMSGHLSQVAAAAAHR